MPITSIQQTLNMEEVDKGKEEESEPSVLSENQEAKNTVSTQDVEVNPTMEAGEELNEESASESQPEEREMLISPQSIINMQRDFTLVTNIVAADAKESMRRTELEEARRIRLERLENEVKSSQEIFQEITRGWSIAKQKVIPQDLQEALNNQQQLCAAIIENNKKCIKDLQQEMKVGDDRFVKELRNQDEELDLMIDMMDNQMKTLTKAYREELAQISRVYHLESEVLLTTDKTDWEQRIMELCDEELGRSMEWKKKVEEYDAKVQNYSETIDNNADLQTKRNMRCQVLEKQQQKKAGQMLQTLVEPTVEVQRLNLFRMKKRAARLHLEIRNLRTKSSSENKKFTKLIHHLPKEYKQKIQQYEHFQNNIKYFADADARQFEEMWLMMDAEVKQLVERVLVIDSLICKGPLGLAWERTPLECMELSVPIQPQKQATVPARQAVSQLNLQCSQRMMDLSVGPRSETDTESMDKEMYKEEKTVQSESGAEVEEGTLIKVMELLCDEAGFLMEDELLNLLAPLEKEEQTGVKLGSLLCSFGIEEEDVPKLAEFLLKYEHQQRDETEDVCVESGESSNKEEDVETKSMTHLSSELINPNHILPALKSFLEQHMRTRESSASSERSASSESSASQNHSFHDEAWDTSENEAYWESMGNIISEDKVKLWDATENTLKQYLAVLTEISDLIPETQSLEQEYTELRMLLQQPLN